MTYNFPKEERLHSKKLIQELFEKGSSFYLYPFKVMYLPYAPEIPAHQLLVSVAKRRFKNAVDRNLIKRRIKETYRLNKHMLLKADGQPLTPLLIGLVYTGKEIHDTKMIDFRMKKLITQLTNTAI
ncbi:ribonuclease P protein component [Roseivirga echinicomitans]